MTTPRVSQQYNDPGERGICAFFFSILILLLFLSRRNMLETRAADTFSFDKSSLTKLSSNVSDLSAVSTGGNAGKSTGGQLSFIPLSETVLVPAANALIDPVEVMRVSFVFIRY